MWRSRKAETGRSVGLARFVGRELIAYAVHGALLPLDADTPRPGEGPIVLFLHGHGGGPGAFLPLRRALSGVGYRRFAGWSYRSTSSIADVAEKLRRFVQDELAGEQLLVVGHSLGGIIARFWLQELGGREQALALATLSSPHQGIVAVPGAKIVPLIRELLPGSPFLDQLNRGVDRLAGLPCISVVSTRDHFVRPWTRAGHAHANLMRIDRSGHVGVLFSTEVHDAVASHLLSVARPKR